MHLYLIRRRQDYLKKRSASKKDDANWPHIVQMSWLLCDMETGKIISIHDYIIKLADHLSIPPDSTKVHGITNDIMREKRYFYSESIRNF